jgi:hypothetical protein
MVYHEYLAHFNRATVTGRAVRLLRPFFINSDMGYNAIFTASGESRKDPKVITKALLTIDACTGELPSGFQPH